MGKTVVLLTTGQAPSYLRIRPNDKFNVHSIHTFEFICAEVNLSVCIITRLHSRKWLMVKMYTDMRMSKFYGPGLFSASANEGVALHVSEEFSLTQTNERSGKNGI